MNLRKYKNKAFAWKWSFGLTGKPFTDLFNILLLFILLVVLNGLGSSGISLLRKVKKYEEENERAQTLEGNEKFINDGNVGSSVINNYHLMKDLDGDKKGGVYS